MEKKKELKIDSATNAQIGLWIDAMMDTLERPLKQLSLIDHIDDIEPNKYINIIRDQYRTLEIIYNVETKRTIISGVRPISKQSV
jgi:hypothetical protein